MMDLLDRVPDPFSWSTGIPSPHQGMSNGRILNSPQAVYVSPGHIFDPVAYQVGQEKP